MVYAKTAVPLRGGRASPISPDRGSRPEARPPDAHRTPPAAFDQVIPSGYAAAVSEETIQLELDDSGVSVNLPPPSDPKDRVHSVPYRPVEFRDDDLPTALERSATWLREAQQWLGEPLDVVAVHLDYDDREGAPYYELKLLCNEEDLAGAPIAKRDLDADGSS